jgi:hypothetical protein
MEDFALSLIRKVIWPAALAMGFLVFLGAIGQGGVKSVSAAAGDLCRIDGPYIQGIHGEALGLSENKTMHVGQRALLLARTENNTNRVQDYDVDLDDEIGDSDIVVITEPDTPWQLDEEPGTDQVDANAVIQLTNAAFIDGDVDDPSQLTEEFGWRDNDDGDGGLNPDIEDIFDDFEEDFGYEFMGDVCFGTRSGSGKFFNSSVLSLIEDCIDFSSGPEEFCDEDAWESLTDDDDGDSISVKEIAQLIVDELNGGENSCDDIAYIVGQEIIGLSNDDEDAIQDDIWDICAGEASIQEGRRETDTAVLDSWWDDFSPIVVECIRPGIFEVTFTEDDDPDQFLTIEITCLGDAASESTISVRPNRVEIIPALGNVSHSLVTVTLLDEDGEPAGTGFEVDFSTNICSIETGGVNDMAKFDAADTIFRAYNTSVSATAQAVEDSAAAKAAVDSTRQADTVTAFDNDGDTVAAAILGCGPWDTGTAATPGTATITARIEVLDGQDVILTATVTVVGPPADLRVTASPSTLRCGEKATITATVKDSIGQNVSEHTRVEAVTNAGGVLGGTGAVAGQAGPVVPVASTVAETFDGVATFYLLTSDQHVGPYEVVVTTGGSGSVTDALGGVFSTRPQVAQQTVTCTLPTPAPAPQPTISAPRTGTGTAITPPSTGDAGLLSESSSSTSWTLLAAIAVVASLVGVAGLKLVRR